MKTPVFAWGCVLLAPALARAANVGSGLIGYYFDPYRPPCAHACVRSLTSYMLSCSSHGDEGSSHGHHGSGMTSPECRANDTAWLTTLAWCVNEKCAPYDEKTSVLEAFWEDQSTQDPAVSPKWDYGTAYHEIADRPTRELTPDDDTINGTVLVSEPTYEAQFNALRAVYREIRLENQYG